MISVSSAKRILNRNVTCLEPSTIPLAQALGFVLAEEIHAPMNLPAFDNSAMDGFVLMAKDTWLANRECPVSFKIQGTIRAGDGSFRRIYPGEAFRIMTGAPLPVRGDTVLAKEEAQIQGNRLIVSQTLENGLNVRRQGEEIKRGQLVLRSRTFIHAGVLAFLASMGIVKVKVFRKPSVSVIATGSELVTPGRKIRRGEIYDSNSFMIRAVLEQMGIKPAKVMTVKDNPCLLKNAVREALKKSDVVILTGGVSVGDYDYARQVLTSLGVRSLFWKVSQKPGKPIYFGKKNSTLIFGLPGNPASVYTCFYEYVYPALRKMTGFASPDLAIEFLNLSEPVKADPKRHLFLKGKRVFGQNGFKPTVSPLPRQGSHMLSSLCESDGFISIPPRQREYEKGERVSMHLLPVGGNR